MGLGATTNGISRAINGKRLNDLCEEATIDYYNEGEELCGLFTRIQDELEVPFEKTLGVPVTVERIDLKGD